MPGKNVILVAHIDEKEDEGRMIKRPMIATKISAELVNMVDIVGYMTVVSDGEKERRVILVDPTSDKYVAKDRTGTLGKVIAPNFTQIIKAINGDKKYKWAKEVIVPKKTDKPDEKSETSEKKEKLQKKLDKIKGGKNASGKSKS